MTTYDLFLESGPKKKLTMVHVLDLLGCVVVGPTTEEALAATPAGIRAFPRLMKRCGESVDPAAGFETRVAEHVTEGEGLGTGSTYLRHEQDFTPLTGAEIERQLKRIEVINEALAAWAESQADDDLNARPAKGRAANATLFHVLGAQGSYLAAALGGAPGFSRLHGAAERGELPLPVALRESAALLATRVGETTPEQRVAVRELSTRTYTLRKALRRTTEHAWEHLLELSRRPGGPEV